MAYKIYIRGTVPEIAEQLEKAQSLSTSENNVAMFERVKDFLANEIAKLPEDVKSVAINVTGHADDDPLTGRSVRIEFTAS